MDFRPTDDQLALRTGVRELLARRFDRAALRDAVERGGALDRALWRELGDAGFFALCLPETEGGVGLGLPEAVLLFEEAGRVLLPGPLVDTHLAAGEVKGAAEGEVVVTAPHGSLIAHLADADVVRGLPPEELAAAEPVRAVDPLTPLHRLPGPPAHTGHAAGGSGATDGTGQAAARFGAAVLLTAAEQAGSASRTVEMAVQHACEREQFGQPIGGFQAVKHLCAQMLVRAEVARTAVYAAAVTGARAEIAGAKLLADEAAVRNARDCLQVCGGMGFTWESDVHLHLKRAWVRAARGPTRAATEDELAADLLAGPSDAPR
ncbi:acyl-CoA dehydrogenase family protein [Streptomyces sp. NPDC091272]|uniref:acyl-CoA dehydrogenase family protein n=1 Tax=Streptomyces sp. NPDC091272 TaxID=3365981 RepID=UPI00382741B9